MDDHRSADALTESAIDREIEAALAIDPSPEFLARVRTRLSSEPAPSGWRLPWVFAAAGAIVIAVILAMPGTNRSPRQNDVANTQNSGTARATPPIATRDSAQDIVVTQDFSPAPRKLSRPSMAVKEPEVLIAADEARAWRRLFELVGQGRIDLSLVPEGPSATAALQPLGDLTIPPIVFEPTTAGEGERQ
jgi:hypothetical protein